MSVQNPEPRCRIFYTYVVVDVPKLIENLGGDAALAGKTVEHLIHLIATVSPGAKKGSTAPYAWADLILVETGERQPRSLANAFRAAIAPSVGTATTSIGDQLKKFDAMYGANESRRAAALEAATALPGVASLETLDLLAVGIAAQIAAD